VKAHRRKAKKQKHRRKQKHKHKAQENHQLPKGLAARVERVVPFEWTIAAYDSRLPAVFSTPSMIGMMEIAAAQAIAPHLPAGTISVGTRIEVDHLKAVPEGAIVEAQARLAGSRGRFLVFEAEARAGETVIGRGRVFRAIVPLEPFQGKASARR
jgi:fluoroacetyl-CoA thioesterase